MNLNKCQICSQSYSKHVLSLIPFVNHNNNCISQSSNDQCHLVCASFIKDVEIVIKTSSSNKAKQSMSEWTAKTSANLKGLAYSQCVCKSCYEVDDNVYVKCIDEDCNDYFHISCIIKNEQKIAIGRWSETDKSFQLLEPMCSQHENKQQYKDITITWQQAEKSIKKKLFQKCDFDVDINSEDEVGDEQKTKEIIATHHKESNSLSQEDSSITKIESKSVKKSQSKQQYKLKQLEENTTISNSAACSIESADNSDISQQQKEILKLDNRKIKSNKVDEISKSIKINKKQEETLKSERKKEEKVKSQSRKEEKSKSERKKEERKKKSTVQQNEQQKENITNNLIGNQQNISIVDNLFKNNTLYKDFLDPTKQKNTEEPIKKNKIKIICGIPQYPNTSDSNRQTLMKQWWKFMNDCYFKEASSKEQQFLQEEEIASSINLGDDNMTNKYPASQNYRYQKLILKSQVYQSMIENDYYLNGNIPSLKNNSFLTVLYENALCNYLIKYEIDENVLQKSTLNALKSQDLNKVKNRDSNKLKSKGTSSIKSRVNPTSQSNILKVNPISQRNINQIKEAEIEGDSSIDLEDTNSEKDINQEEREYIISEQSACINELLQLADVQGLDKKSFKKSIECSQFIMAKQNEMQEQLLNKDISKEIPNTIEYELIYLQEQLKDILDFNNGEKTRIGEGMQNEEIKYLQIDYLERQSRKVYDILKWNTIIRYMQVGYGEKNEEILLTYIKNDSDQQSQSYMDDHEKQNEGNTSSAGKNDPTRRSKIFQQICLRNTDGYIEIDCKVCFNNYSNEANPVVYCSLCSASFHQFCYGIKEIPHEDFLCDLCLYRQQQAKNEQISNQAKNNNNNNNNNNNTQEISQNPKPQQKRKKREHRLLCKICMKTGFPMVDVNHQFYHVSCLIFVNMIYIKDSCLSLRGGEDDEQIQTFQNDILDIVVKSEFATHICAICQKRQGYKLKCAHPNCILSFHTHCAYIDGIHFDIQIHDNLHHPLSNISNSQDYLLNAQDFIENNQELYSNKQDIQDNKKHIKENKQDITSNREGIQNNNTPIYQNNSDTNDSIDRNFHRISAKLYCPNHQPVKDRDEILQIYLRRYGINLYKTATEFKDYHSFTSEHQYVLKELKQKIEDTRNKIEKEIQSTNEQESSHPFNFINDYITCNEEDITSIFGDINEESSEPKKNDSSIDKIINSNLSPFQSTNLQQQQQKQQQLYQQKQQLQQKQQQYQKDQYQKPQQQQQQQIQKQISENIKAQNFQNTIKENSQPKNQNMQNCKLNQNYQQPQIARQLNNSINERQKLQPNNSFQIPSQPIKMQSTNRKLNYDNKRGYQVYRNDISQQQNICQSNNQINNNSKSQNLNKNQSLNCTSTQKVSDISKNLIDANKMISDIFSD